MIRRDKLLRIALERMGDELNGEVEVRWVDRRETVELTGDPSVGAFYEHELSAPDRHRVALRSTDPRGRRVPDWILLTNILHELTHARQLEEAGSMHAFQDRVDDEEMMHDYRAMPIEVEARRNALELTRELLGDEVPTDDPDWMFRSFDWPWT